LQFSSLEACGKGLTSDPEWREELPERLQ
jgi:hypothetical protein